MKKIACLAAGLGAGFLLSACRPKPKKSISFQGNWKVITGEGKKELRLLNLPNLRQATGYTCGVSSLQSVLFYYGLEYREDVLAGYAGSSFDAGTPPQGLLQAVAKVNEEKGTRLQAEIRQDATIEEIKKWIDREVPVIVDIQAWREPENQAPWKEDWIDGHYVVAIGYDDDNLYFQDPSLIYSVGRIPQKEFLDRWHDYEGAEDYDAGRSVTTRNLLLLVRGEKPKPPALCRRIR